MTAQIVSGIVIGAAVAVVGAFATHLFILKREREHWEREERRQRETREHEWQLRHRDDRLEVYRRFLADVHQFMARRMDPEGFRAAEDAAQETKSEIALLGSTDVYLAAGYLLEAQVELARYWAQEEAGELPEDAPEKTQKIGRLLTEMTECHSRFVRAARKDLGTDFDIEDFDMEDFDPPEQPVTDDT